MKNSPISWGGGKEKNPQQQQNLLQKQCKKTQPN